MEDDLNLSFSENKIYLTFILILSLTLFYYDIFIGVLALCILGYMIYYNNYLITSKESKLLVDIKNLSLDIDKATKQTMLDFPMGLCILDYKGSIKWHNDALSQIFGRENLINKNIGMYLKNYDLEQFLPQEGENESKLEGFALSGKIYDIYSVNLTKNSKRSNKYAMYFFDVTREIELSREYEKVLPTVLQIQVDSYDEVLSSTTDDYRSVLSGEIDKQIRQWIERFNGIVTRFESDRYFALVTDPMLDIMEDEKFSILDDIRNLVYTNTIPVTLSIGASDFETNLEETNKNAFSALELALGRGGDQAVLKRQDNTLFFGGKSSAVEKKTRVKARIVGHSLRDLVLKASHVLVMGHSNADMDAIGSAMGVSNIAKLLGVPTNIILNESNSSIDVMYKSIINDDLYKDIFVTSDEAKKIIDDKTLLVVVDTHKPSITEMPKALELVDNVVLIDHHRRGVEYIEDTILSYHETYASSASEMVTELIQYVKDSVDVDPIVSTCLLAGITLDTNNFSKKTGVRTFEAAAYLRKNSADILEVKKYFQGDYSSFVTTAAAIKNSRIIGDNVALTSCEEKQDNASLVASHIADELLNIKGVIASFACVKGYDKKIHISARSLEDINVQLIMEKLGGGGHLDTAGAQIEADSTEEVEQMIIDAIKEYQTVVQ